MTMQVAALLAYLAFAQAITTYSIPSFNSPPVPRQYGRSCYDSVSDQLILFGGYPESGSFFSDLWTFNFRALKWAQITTTTSDNPRERKAHACFVDETNRNFYIFGGESDLGLLNDIWALDIDTYTWTQVTQTGDKPFGVSAFASTNYMKDGKLKFVVVRGIGLSEVLKDVFIFDVASAHWTRLKSKGDPPKSERDGAVAYYQDKLYFYGGYKEEDNRDPSLSDKRLYIYDMGSETWNAAQTTNSIRDRSAHALTVYNGYLYFFQGWSEQYKDQREVYKVKLQSSTYTWELVPYEGDMYSDSLPYDAYGFDFKGSKGYFTCGWNVEMLKNDLMVVDLAKPEPLTFEAITTYYLAPSARMHHRLEYVGTKLLMFGGQGQSAKLGDLWVYDIPTEEWTPKKMIGSPPAPRSGFSTCTVGDNMYLYGGEGDLYLNQDFYFYDMGKEKWTMVETVEWPPARKHACMICDYPRFYILGGITINGYVSEVWEVDLQALTTRLLSENEGPEPFAFTNCFGEHSDSGFVISIISGETKGEYPLTSTYQYNVKGDEWAEISDFRLMSRSAINKIGDKVINAGGENWGLYAFKEVYATDFSTGEETYLGDLPRKMYSGASTYVKSALYLHGGGDTLGYKFRFAVPIADFVRVELNENCSECSWACSPGTYLNEDNVCEFCAPGSYSSSYESCTLCSPGTASKTSGNTSPRQCRPCDEGYFSSEEGSRLCLTCPGSYICPVGSKSPVRFSEPPQTVKSSQPAVYSSNAAFISTLSFSLEIAIGVLGAGTLGAFVHFKEKTLFKGLDMFKKHHNHFTDEAMYIRKRPIGGLFSIWFILVALFFMIISMTTFTLNNIQETKALVPLVAVENKYKNLVGTFNLTTTFQNFVGTCQTDNECSETISVLVEKLSGTYNTKCYELSNGCEIKLSCFDCEMVTGSNVKYILLETINYATGITVNMTSTSSIPEEFSSIEQILLASENYVFRGPAASHIYFEVTPSIFNSQESDQEDTTGFHVAATKASVSGSQVPISELSSTVGLKLNVYLDKSSSGLTTRRELKSTLLQLLSSMLGSVFGLMSIFESMMQVTEKQWIVHKRSQKSTSRKKHILNNLRTYIQSTTSGILPSTSRKDRHSIVEASSTTFDELNFLSTSHIKERSFSGSSSPIMPYAY